MIRVARCLLLLLALVAATVSSGARAADTATNGTFRFLTQSLPVGTTNAEYVARLFTANADGPVTFALGAVALPTGVTLDTTNGFLTGRPTSTFSKDVTFDANDGATTIHLTVNLKVNASGGGGNAGATFGGLPLAQGRIGEAYTHTVSVENAVGPVVFGVAALPPGLTLDGTTGTISGTPVAAGTFNVELSATDHGENENKVVSVATLKIFPGAASDFAFTTTVLNNGEVGTPYCDTWIVARTVPGPVVSPRFSGSGLPAGLAVNADTGVVSGTPTAAGTFEVSLAATAGGETISTNLTMLVAPSASSSFYWNFFGIPAALVNVAYTRQPSIIVTAVNGTTVSYTAVGLPEGIVYDPLTGAMSGTATEVGEFPVTFTATDAVGGAVISLSLDFIVLPATGGSATQVAVNAWLTRMKVKAGVAGADVWKGACIYNADRRTGHAFDPATQAILLQLGSSLYRVEPGTLKAVNGARVFRTAKGVTPAMSVVLSAQKQTLSWSIVKAALTETLPGTLTEQITVGSRGYRLQTFVEPPGKLIVPRGLRRASFVASKARIAVSGPAKDAATISFLLDDPAFTYESGISTLRVRLLEGATVLADRDFTALGTATVDATRTGSQAYKMRIAPDGDVSPRVAAFSYFGAKAKGKIVIDRLTLPALTDGEAHLGVELTVGSRVYFTSVTFFERRANQYSVP